MYSGGSVKPNHQIDYIINDPVELGTGYIAESDVINLNDFKTISSISMVGGGS